GLTGRDAGGGLQQLDLDAVARDDDPRAVLGTMGTQLHRDIRTVEHNRHRTAPAGLDAGHPVDTELLAATDRDRAGDWLDVQDEARLAIGSGHAQAKALALPDREVVGPLVLAKDHTRHVDDGP